VRESVSQSGVRELVSTSEDCWSSGAVSRSCEKVIAEADDRPGTQRKGNVRRWSRYQNTTGEDTADWEVLVLAVVNCRVCELALVL
jgi:hypothetical protein